MARRCLVNHGVQELLEEAGAVGVVVEGGPLKEARVDLPAGKKGFPRCAPSFSVFVAIFQSGVPSSK